MGYLGDSWQIHQCEVDDVRGEDLQVNGIVADSLQRNRKLAQRVVRHRIRSSEIRLDSPAGCDQMRSILLFARQQIPQDLCFSLQQYIYNLII